MFGTVSSQKPYRSLPLHLLAIIHITLREQRLTAPKLACSNFHVVRGTLAKFSLHAGNLKFNTHNED